MISKEEFIAHCDAQIPQEEKDKYSKKTKKLYITLLCVLVGELLSAFILSKIWVYSLFLLIPISIIVDIILIVKMKYKWGEFKRNYSKVAFDCLLKDYKYEFEPDYCIGEMIFDASGFGDSYDSYGGEDLLSINIPNDDGTPSDIDLKVCDLRVTRTETRTVTVTNKDGSTSTKEETYTVTVYDGVFGYIYFPFKFKCNMSLNIHFRGQDKIKLEDIKFNKTFKTYTDDQLETLVILTPTLINKLIAFSNRVNKFKLSLRRDGSLYFGMNGNLFRLKSFFKKPSGKVFERYYDDTLDLLLLVNEIKNNNKVFNM